MENNECIFKDLLHTEPLVLVISGPSGVGKDAVLQTLRQKQLPFHIVVTSTTRQPRPGEQDGVDYFFVSHANFEAMIANDELIEHALVYQDYKGIPKQQVRSAIASGKDVILRVDVQGAARMRAICPGAVMIFLVPEDEDEWMQRLRGRASETEEGLRLRVETARQEVARIGEFDYIVVNSHGKLDQAVEAILNIIDAEHHRVEPRKVTL
jgi:guanylate kinase